MLTFLLVLIGSAIICLCLLIPIAVTGGSLTAKPHNWIEAKTCKECGQIAAVSHICSKCGGYTKDIRVRFLPSLKLTTRLRGYGQWQTKDEYDAYFEERA